MKASDKSSGLPNWLKHLQENSWELELLISGGAVFSLFQFSDYFLHGVQAARIISYLPGAMTIVTIGMLGIQILTLGFILHLIFRAYWLALVCINYVFPNGIDHNKVSLKKPFKNKQSTAKDLKEQIIGVDKLCGLLMYMSIVSALTIFGLIILTIVTLPFSVYLDQSFLSISISYSAIFLILLLIYIIDLLSFGLLRKIPWLSYLLYPVFRLYDLISLRFLYERSLKLFSTNIKKGKFLIAAFCFACVAMLNTYLAIYKAQHWTNFLDDRDYIDQRAKDIDEQVFYSGVADLHYLENWNDQHYYVFGLGKKIVKGNLVEIYLRYEKAFDVVIKASSPEPQERYFSNIVEVRLDKQIVDVNWHPAKKANNDIGIMAMIDLSQLENGEHSVVLTVKDKYFYLYENLINRPKSILIPFWIDRPLSANTGHLPIDIKVK